jgi:hypothetical protein
MKVRQRSPVIGVKNSIIYRKMEDNIRIIEFNGLSNNQYIEELKTILLSGEVTKISFFITYKEKLVR